MASLFTCFLVQVSYAPLSTSNGIWNLNYAFPGLQKPLMEIFKNTKVMGNGNISSIKFTFWSDINLTISWYRWCSVAHTGVTGYIIQKMYAQILDDLWQISNKFLNKYMRLYLTPVQESVLILACIKSGNTLKNWIKILKFGPWWTFSCCKFQQICTSKWLLCWPYKMHNRLESPHLYLDWAVRNEWYCSQS